MEKMADRSTTVTPLITSQTKRLLELMGVAIVNAPCEAEATCAELVKHGLCHAVATEDADALTFGANIVVRNIFSTDVKKRPMFEVNLGRCLEQLDIDMEKFIDFCILSGCDYTDTIKGVGSKTAFQLVKEHGDISAIIKRLDADKIPNPFPYEDARELFKHHDVVNCDQLVKGKSAVENGHVGAPERTSSSAGNNASRSSGGGASSSSSSSPAHARPSGGEESPRKKIKVEGQGASIPAGKQTDTVDLTESLTSESEGPGEESEEGMNKTNTSKSHSKRPPLAVTNTYTILSPGDQLFDFKKYYSSKPQPNSAGLRQFLVEENQFDGGRVDKQIGRLEKGLKEGIAHTMDQFFEFRPPPITAKDKYDPFKGKKKKATPKGTPKGTPRKGANSAAKNEVEEDEMDKFNSGAGSGTPGGASGSGGTPTPAKFKRKGALTAAKIEADAKAKKGAADRAADAAAAPSSARSGSGSPKR